jgi:hypothetical protein
MYVIRIKWGMVRIFVGGRGQWIAFDNPFAAAGNRDKFSYAKFFLVHHF